MTSIIVNNFNYAPYLAQAIDSALAQTVAAEVIVVDDGSTDESRAIVERYGAKLRPIFKANGGQASAFAAGFAVCRGDPVVFLDADDLLMPHAVERAAPCFEHGTVANAHWPLAIIDAEGRPTGRRMPAGELAAGDLRAHLIEHGPDSYLGVPCSGNAWSRRFLQHVLPVADHSSYRHGADGYLITLAPLFGAIARLEDVLGCYRIHGANQYWHASVEQRLAGSLQRYEARSRTLAAFLEREGLHPSPARWRDESDYHRWMTRLSQALASLRPLLAPRDRFILLDQGEWGGQLFAGIEAYPLPEKNGIYNGLPADDESAIQELERLRAAGAASLVWAWPAFWWAEHYRGFARHVRTHYSRIANNEQFWVYDLRKSCADS